MDTNFTTYYVTVPGTHSGWGEGWWSDDSEWRAYMLSIGWRHYQHPLGQFQWSGDIDGVWKLFGGKDWEAGATALRYYMRDVPPEVVVIGHSHALQVILRAAALGTRFTRLIDIAGPVRKDMMKAATDGRPNIGHWTHVYDQKADWTAWLGQLGDGGWFGGRSHPLADVNIPLKKISHSNLLHKPEFFPLWADAILPETV